VDYIAEKESLDVHCLLPQFPDAPGTPAERHDPSASMVLFPVGRNARSRKAEIPGVF